MYENFIICVKAVIPIFLFLLVGFIAKEIGLTEEKYLPKVNSLAFKVFFPFLMFNNVYKSELTESIDLKLLIFCIVATFVIYFLGIAYSCKVEMDNRSRGALIQGIYRSNLVIMGLPLAGNIFGISNIGTTAIATAIVVPIYNILAVVTLEKFRDNKADYKSVLINIAKNPMIVGAVVGILASLINISLPVLVEDAISDLAACATPLTLVILGASFKFNIVKAKKKNMIRVCTARLIVVPAIFLTIGYFLGIRGVSFVTLIGVLASPCAVSSFTMAQAMDSDYELAGGTVVITSAIGCFTLFLWLFLFRNLGAF